jgi:hypothetical protein
MGREVEDHGWANGRHDSSDLIRVGKVDGVEWDIARDLGEPPRSRSGPDQGVHAAPPLKEFVHRGCPDESGRPGHQD